MAMATDTQCLALPRGATCYWKEMWEKLNAMRQMWQLCDVTLFSEDNIMYMAHSPVLAASSEVFHNYFVKRIPTIIDELADRKLMLHGVRGDVLQVVLDFIYGVTPPTIEEFEKLKIGADALAIHGAYTYCGEKFYKNGVVPRQSDDATGRGQSVIVYSKPQSPGSGPVSTPKPSVCPVTNMQGGGTNVCPVSNILEPISIDNGGNGLEQAQSSSFPVSSALMPPSGADNKNMLSGDIEMRSVNADVLRADGATNVLNEVGNVMTNKQLLDGGRLTSPTGMNMCGVNVSDVTNRSLTPRDMSSVQPPVTCPFNGKPGSPGGNITPLVPDIGNRKRLREDTMPNTLPVFIPDLKPVRLMKPNHVQNCCGNDNISKCLPDDTAGGLCPLPRKPIGEQRPPSHHDLIPEMTLSDLTVQVECPHLKRLASGEDVENTNAMKTEDGASSPASPASMDNDNSDCASEGSNLESCSADRLTKFSSNYLVCNIINTPREAPMSSDAANCKVEPPTDGAGGQCPEACSSENSNNSFSDTSSEVWAVRPGRPPTAEEEAENTRLLSRLKLNSKKSYTCLVDGCGYTNKHVDYMCSHMYHRHSMGMPTKHCGHCTKAYFSLGQLNNHIKRTHRTKRLVVEVERVTCPDCGNIFDSSYKLQTHQLKVHGKGKLFSCEVCEFKSPRKKDVQAHMLSQHGKAPPGVRVYSCPFCEYKCIDRNRYEEHEAMHTGIQKFECPLCGKAYTTRRGMRTHLKYHSEDRPHTCDICDARFKVRSKLKDHVKLVHTHAGLKPYQCGYCDHSTALRGNCNQHIKKYHPGMPIQVIDHLASKRKSVKDYDYAGLKGEGIHECKDVRAASWASIGNSANFCPPSGPVGVIDQEHGVSVLDGTFQGGATCGTNHGNIDMAVNQARPPVYL